MIADYVLRASRPGLKPVQSSTGPMAVREGPRRTRIRFVVVSKLLLLSFLLICCSIILLLYPSLPSSFFFFFFFFSFFFFLFFVFVVGFVGHAKRWSARPRYMGQKRRARQLCLFALTLFVFLSFSIFCLSLTFCGGLFVMPGRCSSGRWKGSDFLQDRVYISSHRVSR